MKRIYRFFFPPEGATTIRRVAPFLVIALAILLGGVVSVPAWEYSNSPEFCGTTCHTMPPEYQTYLVSPHARVLCVDCHIGRGPFFEQLAIKSTHMRLLWATATGNFHYPIRASSMRPARETCEECHYPAKFSDDSLRTLNRFRNDEDNSPYDLYLLMHTGGGSQREGLGRGIHWHVENPIQYIALDPEEQEIPWIRVTTVDGETIEYVADDAEIDLDNIDQYELHEMDCITCHNRISHLFENPRLVVDSALYQGDISTDIPYIRQEAISVLEANYESADEAEEAISGLATFYQTEYPDFYADEQEQVTSAVDLLIDLYSESNYFDQELHWDTHPNNIGHRDSPGCFRCHDGQHFNEAGEAVRLECNLCHSIPQVVEPTDIEPTLPLTTGLEPASHLDTRWISQHHNAFDQTCAACHTTENPGGTTDTSFCSNSACHGVDWAYGGFDALTLRTELGIESPPVAPPIEVPAEGTTYADLQPVFELTCAQCHGEAGQKGLNVLTYDSLMAGSESGPVIVPGDSANSLLVAVLSEQHFANFTPEDLDLVKAWIDAGAPPGEAAPEPAEPAEGAAEAASYAALQPVLEATCGQCHGAAALKGLNVTTYDTLMAGSENGPVIVPGDSAASRIIEVMSAPHSANLTPEELELLKAWIDAGAPAGEAAAEPPAEPAEGAAEAASYAALQPVLEATCGQCHGAAALKGLNVTTYDTLMAGSENGPVIVPGDSAASRIIEVMSAPHSANLTPEELELLKAWIDAGAPAGEAAAEPAASAEDEGEAGAAPPAGEPTPAASEDAGSFWEGDPATASPAEKPPGDSDSSSYWDSGD